MNKFTVKNNTAELEVSGKTVLIDAEDLNKVLGKQWYWSVVKGKVITEFNETPPRLPSPVPPGYPFLTIR